MTINKQSAFGLIELTIALGIMGIIAYLTLQVFDQFNQSRYRIEALSTRDALNLRIRRVISKQNLTFSARAISNAGNSKLLQCIDGNPATICDVTRPEQAQSFRLGYPTQTGGRILAGSDQQPVSYAHNGAVCQNNSLCQPEFEAKVYFSAVCQNQAASCGDALVIRVRYQIRNISLKDQPLLPALPPDQEFSDPLRGIIPIVFSDANYSSSCPPFSVLRSIDSRGVLTCVCQPGASKVGEQDGQPKCAPKPIKCPNNQTHRLIGYTPSMEAICVPRAKWSCSTMSTETECPGIVQGIALGKCYVETSNQTKGKKSSTSQSISCMQNQYVCCTEK